MKSHDAQHARLPPAPRDFQLQGPAAAHARLEHLLGAPIREGAEAHAVALGPLDAVDVASVSQALPAARDLPGGTLVVVLGTIVEPASIARRVLSVFGRPRHVSRELRSSALLLRGYTRLGASLDPQSGVDSAWGYAPDKT